MLGADAFYISYGCEIDFLIPFEEQLLVSFECVYLPGGQETPGQVAQVLCQFFHVTKNYTGKIALELHAEKLPISLSFNGILMDQLDK